MSWDVLSNDEDFPRGQRLIIKQILLGAEAKDDEFNVVEVSEICITPANGSIEKLCIIFINKLTRSALLILHTYMAVWL